MTNEKRTCAVVGSPIAHSVSPLIHNAAYNTLGLDYTYKALVFESAKKAIELMKEKQFRGYSVTIPLKIEIMEFLDELDLLAKQIGAVNTVVNENGFLKGYNTDALGAIKAIKKVMPLQGKKVAIFGAGGAARAIAFGLCTASAKVLIVNRTISKAEKLAAELGCQFSKSAEPNLEMVELLINATPVGMHPKNTETIISEFPAKAVVMDIVYNPIKTKLLQLAETKGCRIIDGSKMFLYQAAEQFKLFTGSDAPFDIMKKAFLERLV